MKIAFADELDLPPDAVTQTFAMLARRGAGKTFTAQKLAEGMLKAKAQVVVIEPVGNWYGLRIAANGEDPGIPIPVFGGEHGDVPLEPGAGAMVADLVVDKDISVILDVSNFRKHERKRFSTDFAEQLFHRKKTSRSPLHLFIEEAQVFVPQHCMKDEARMLGAFEDIVKLGRNYGIGCTLISQRPQSVNKDALNQTECLVVLQTNGAQERKAIEAWIVAQGLEEELVDSLPSLKRGEAWVWSPSWLRVTQRVHISKKWTFDASATPEVGKRSKAPAMLAALDVGAIRTAMAQVVKEAEAKDPVVLRKRIAELEMQLAKKPTAVPEQRIERVEVPVLKDGQLKAMQEIAQILRASAEKAVEVSRTAMSVANGMTEAVASATGPHAKGRVVLAEVAAHPPARAARVARAPAGDETEFRLVGKMRDILGVLGAYPSGAPRTLVATYVDLSSSGGTYQTYLSRLRTAGMIESLGDDRIRLTPLGISSAGSALLVRPSTAAGWLAFWRHRLTGKQIRILEHLAAHGTVAYGELAAVSELEGDGGTFQTYLSRLRTAGLVTAGNPVSLNLDP